MALAIVAMTAATSRAQVTHPYSNATAFAVPANGPATPYSTSITVPTLRGTVTNVTVTLKDVTHQDPRAMRVILRGPLLSRSAAILEPNPLTLYSPSAPASHQDLVFTSRSLLPFYSTYPNVGPYSPSNVAAIYDPLPSPATGGVYPATLDTYIGTAPAGEWTLFVAGAGGALVASGTIGGWTLQIETAESTLPMAVDTTITTSTNYGAPITISTLRGPITHISATLYGLSHTYPADLDVLLVGPDNTGVMLMSGAGSSIDVSGLTLTFDDDAATFIPDVSSLASGSYKPKDYPLSVTLPAPAPPRPYKSLSDWVGTNPNGTWHLYVQDHSAGDAGQITGWSLAIATTGAFGVTSNPTGGSTLSTTEGGTIIGAVIRVGGIGGTVGATITGASPVNPGDATPGVDYTVAGNPAYTFPPGVAQLNFLINTIHDGVGEGTETSTILLTNPTGGVALLPPSLHIEISDPQLSLTLITPSSGRTAGGNDVLLRILYGEPGMTITWDGVPLAGHVLSISGDITFIYVTAPPHAAGPISIGITAPGLPAYTKANAYTYITPPDDPTLDSDGDGMPDAWELRFGLDPHVNDAGDDLDNDGVLNLQEYQHGTHPSGFFKRYLAEGATGGFFNTSIATLNVDTAPATVVYQFQAAGGATTSDVEWIDGMRRATLDPAAIIGGAEFSTFIESDREIVVDRTMTWPASNPYGSHLETASTGPSKTWYLAEGATNSSFDLFYLLQNPNDTPVTATVQYDLPAPQAPIVKTYPLAAHSRTTVYVNQEAKELAWNEIAAEISADAPIMVERAMYRSGNGRIWDAGHAGAAVTAPASDWFFAEGATGSFFDLFLLLMNPNGTDAAVDVKYLLTSGQVVEKQYAVAAHSRRTVAVDAEDPQLADAAVSTIVHSATPIVAERAMWWPDQLWYESHAAAGATGTGTRWAVAEGESGGPGNAHTFILIANTSAFAGSATVTLLFEDGTQAAKTFPLAPTSRFNVDMSVDFDAASNRRYGAIVQSVDTGSGLPLIVVERAIYADGDGQVWGMGGASLGTKLQ